MRYLCAHYFISLDAAMQTHILCGNKRRSERLRICVYTKKCTACLRTTLVTSKTHLYCREMSKQKQH